MQKYYWRTKNGELIDVDDMTKGHLRNVLKMILRAREVRASHTLTEITLEGECAQMFNEEQEEAEYGHAEDSLW